MSSFILPFLRWMSLLFMTSLSRKLQLEKFLYQLPNNTQRKESQMKRARSINKPMHFFLLAQNTPPIRDICSASDANKSGERFAPASVPLARARSSCCAGACLRLSLEKCVPYGDITIMNDLDVILRCTSCSML